MDLWLKWAGAVVVFLAALAMVVAADAVKKSNGDLVLVRLLKLLYVLFAVLGGIMVGQLLKGGA